MSKKAKAKKGAEEHRCAHCGEDGATLRCGRCQEVWYCDRTIVNKKGKQVNPCQKVKF